MAEYNIDGFQDYLESVCEKHTDVKHNVEGKRTFARFHSSEQVQELTNNAGHNIVVVGSFYGSATGAPDEKALRQYITIRFASHSKTFTTEAISQALAISWQIMWDFVARFRKDLKDDNCGILEGIQLKDISYDEIPDQPFLDHHYGWELTVPLRGEQPAYNAAKWIA